jgi:hypothetical protein
MPEKETKQLLLENLGPRDILFRNFAGVQKQYNDAGKRNFSVKLEPEMARQLLAEGWRVKQLKAREDDEEGDYHMKVTVNFSTGRPPHCVLLSSRGRTDLGMDEVMILDVADIKKVDCIINGWWSDMAGGGYGAFLKSIFVTINEDELELKYAALDTPDPDDE